MRREGPVTWSRGRHGGGAYSVATYLWFTHDCFPVGGWAVAVGKRVDPAVEFRVDRWWILGRSAVSFYLDGCVMTAPVSLLMIELLIVCRRRFRSSGGGGAGGRGGGWRGGRGGGRGGASVLQPRISFHLGNGDLSQEWQLFQQVRVLSFHSICIIWFVTAVSLKNPAIQVRININTNRIIRTGFTDWGASGIHRTPESRSESRNWFEIGGCHGISSARETEMAGAHAPLLR